LRQRKLVSLATSIAVALGLCAMATPAQASETGSSPLTLSRDADVVARFGFGSDIHIGRSSGVYGTALEKFNHALQTYASLNVDAVGFSGDLTNNGKSSEYAELMNAISTNLPSSDKVILSMGNHETYDPGMAQASARFKSATGQDMNKLTSVNGIDVITLGPQNSDSDYRADYDFLHTALDSISSRQGYDPAQPIIVLTHHAVQNTAYVSNEWHGNYGEGSGQDLVALMQQYPQIVQVSGHSHATLEDARSIDQTLGYTSIQDGTIGAYFENESGKVDPSSGDGATRPADSELSSQGIIVDIHRDGTTEVHRLNFATGTWIYPQEPWIFSAAEARNDKYGKNRSSSPAVFAHDATVGFDTSATSTTKAVVTFPSAQAADDTNNNMVHSYAITLTPASGGEAVKKSVFSDYYYADKGTSGIIPTKKDQWSVTIKGLQSGTTYTAKVEALTSFQEQNALPGASIGSGASTVTTTEAPAVARKPILDVNYGLGNADDHYQHVSAKQGTDSAIVEDASLGQQVLSIKNSDGGYRYAMTPADYEAIENGFTTDVMFSLPDVKSDQCVFSNQQVSGYGFEVENGKLEFWMNPADGSKPRPSTAISANTWYHATAVYDGSTVSLYLNGDLVSSASAKGGLKIPGSGAQYFFVGADTSSSGTPEYQVKSGSVALARITSQIFTPAEVLASHGNVVDGSGSSASSITAKSAARSALESTKDTYTQGQQDFTASSWTAFSTAYDDVVSGLGDFRTEPGALSTSAASLVSAHSALAKAVDTAALKSLLTTVKAIDRSPYTAESLKALDSAQTTAAALLQNGAMTQQDVDAAVKTLQQAVDSLARIPETPNNPTNQDGNHNSGDGKNTDSDKGNTANTTTNGTKTSVDAPTSGTSDDVPSGASVESPSKQLAKTGAGFGVIAALSALFALMGGMLVVTRKQRF
jgi:hypothetical protein